MNYQAGIYCAVQIYHIKLGHFLLVVKNITQLHISITLKTHTHAHDFLIVRVL